MLISTAPEGVDKGEASESLTEKNGCCADVRFSLFFFRRGQRRGVRVYLSEIVDGSEGFDRSSLKSIRGERGPLKSYVIVHVYILFWFGSGKLLYF